MEDCILCQAKSTLPFDRLLVLWPALPHPRPSPSSVEEAWPRQVRAKGKRKPWSTISCLLAKMRAELASIQLNVNSMPRRSRPLALCGLPRMLGPLLL